MSLTIENEETCRLASELATLTGESEADAIAAALRERIKRQREADERFARMRAISRRTAELFPPLADGEELSITHGKYLYDERGLPK